MKNEIKEINLSEMLFNSDERLLDYITNLQDKNDNLKEWVEYFLNENILLTNKINNALELLAYYKGVPVFETHYKELYKILGGE